MSSLGNDQQQVIREGILRRCKKNKIFKTKWVEHYFVLYCRDRVKGLYSLDEYKSKEKKDLKKTFNLGLVNKIEKNLTLVDPTLSCSPKITRRFIFGIRFRLNHIQKDLYLAAKYEEEMNDWVKDVCRTCTLRCDEDEEQEQNEISMENLESSLRSGLSVSSQSLDDILQGQHIENKSDSVASSIPLDASYMNNFPENQEVLESCSDTSSMYSSSRKNITTTEEDSASCISGPPVPSAWSKYNKMIPNRAFKKNKLESIPASTSIGVVTNENDSSGETLKIPIPARSYPESVTSCEGFGGNYERVSRDRIRRAPPPIDRSNKPKCTKGYEDEMMYRNLSRNNTMESGHSRSHHYSSYSRTLTHSDMRSNRRNLDYFEPSSDPRHSSSRGPAATRSPTPSDVEYITVDVDRTLAFKQMRRDPQSIHKVL